MAVKPGMSVTKDRLPQLAAAVRSLTRADVLVGVPREEDRREDEPMGNAGLAYIHDKGSPAANIPARPFMQPGIKAATPKITSYFKQVAEKALSGDAKGLESALTAAGLAAQSAIRKVINAGPPPPLEAGTIAARKRRGRRSEKPLVDTGQLRNAINFVVRRK